MFLRALSFSDQPRPQSLSQSQIQGAALGRAFSDQAVSAPTLTAMSAGSLAGQFARLASLSLAPSARLFSSLVALGAETFAFEASHRACESFLNRPASENLWKWNGEGGLRSGCLSTFVNLTSLRGFGFLFQGRSALFQALSADLGMVAGQRLMAAFEGRTESEENFLSQLAQAEITRLQLAAGGQLARALLPSATLLERSLEPSAQSARGRARSEASHEEIRLEILSGNRGDEGDSNRTVLDMDLPTRMTKERDADRARRFEQFWNDPQVALHPDELRWYVQHCYANAVEIGNEGTFLMPAHDILRQVLAELNRRGENTQHIISNALLGRRNGEEFRQIFDIAEFLDPSVPSARAVIADMLSKGMTDNVPTEVLQAYLPYLDSSPAQSALRAMAIRVIIARGERRFGPAPQTEESPTGMQEPMAREDLENLVETPRIHLISTEQLLRYLNDLPSFEGGTMITPARALGPVVQELIRRGVNIGGAQVTGGAHAKPVTAPPSTPAESATMTASPSDIFQMLETPTPGDAAKPQTGIALPAANPPPPPSLLRRALSALNPLNWGRRSNSPSTLQLQWSGPFQVDTATGVYRYRFPQGALPLTVGRGLFSDHRILGDPLISKKHLSIVRRIDPSGLAYVLTAHNITVIHRASGGQETFDHNETAWLHPGDRVVVSPHASFIFDPVE